MTPTPALRADPPHKGEGNDRVRCVVIDPKPKT
jgi:hypothetical protein